MDKIVDSYQIDKIANRWIVRYTYNSMDRKNARQIY